MWSRIFPEGFDDDDDESESSIVFKYNSLLDIT